MKIDSNDITVDVTVSTVDTIGFASPPVVAVDVGAVQMRYP